MAIWEWLHIYNMVPTRSHQFSEYRTRKTVSLLVSRTDNEKGNKKHNMIKKWKPKKNRRQKEPKIEMYYRRKSQCVWLRIGCFIPAFLSRWLMHSGLAPKRNILICNDCCIHCTLYTNSIQINFDWLNARVWHSNTSSWLNTEFHRFQSHWGGKTSEKNLTKWTRFWGKFQFRIRLYYRRSSVQQFAVQQIFIS